MEENSFWRNALFFDMIAPPAPSLPLSGAGEPCDTSPLLVQENSTLLLYTDNTASSQRGRHSGGAMPQERHLKKMNSTEQKILKLRAAC
jgi:hypothetical protein